MISELGGWNSTTLGEVTEEFIERHGQAQTNLPIYGVDRAVGLTPTPKYASDVLSRYKRILPGMFAYNPMRLNIGSIGYCSRQHSPGLISPDYVVFRCLEDRIDSEFMQWLPQSPRWRAWTESSGVGSVRVRIYYRELARMPILLPPLVEQRGIAYILGTLDKKIDLNNQMNKTLEAIALAIFQSWFVDFDPVRAKAVGRDLSLLKHLADLFPDRFQDSELGEIPAGWEVAPLDSILVLQRGFDLPATQRTPGQYPVLAASGPNGTHNKFMVRGPGVTTGRSGLLGKVFYVHEDFWPLNTSLWVREFRHATPAYAFYLLRALDFGLFNTGSAVPTLNRNHVHNLPTLMPPMAIINAFESIAASLLQRQKFNEEQSQILSVMRDTLLPKLISGELRLNDAQRLLERNL